MKLDYDKIKLTIDKLLGKVYPYAADIKGQSLVQLKQIELLYLKEKQFQHIIQQKLNRLEDEQKAHRQMAV